MISRNTIEKVFEISRVEEVIGILYISKNPVPIIRFEPFVDEKTPSFMVSPVKQI